MKVSIIFPCYNEEKNLKALLDTLKAFPTQYDIEFIIVENGSTDGSRDILNRFKDNRIHKVYVKKNQGYGYGIIQGIKVASGDYIGWLHADLQYNPLELTTFLDFILSNPHEKVFLKGSRIGRSKLDRFFTVNMGFLNSLLFGHRMREIMSAPTIAPRCLLEDLGDFPNDFAIDIYIYVLALRNNLKVVHLPIHLRQRSAGNSSWNSGFRARLKMSRTLIIDSLKIKKSLHNKA